MSPCPSPSLCFLTGNMGERGVSLYSRPRGADHAGQALAWGQEWLLGAAPERGWRLKWGGFLEAAGWGRTDVILWGVTGNELVSRAPVRGLTQEASCLGQGSPMGGVRLWSLETGSSGGSRCAGSRGPTRGLV